MTDFDELTDIINNHRDARDWRQFHKPKDLALSLVLEAAEVLEHFQWKNDEEVKELMEKKKENLGEELADVLYWILTLAHDAGIDLKQAFLRKMEINEKKYPVDKAKGSHKKYTEL
ncbi:MAG: nucleotide pyrophosphohydrolase [Patescibacteria group bacterium]|jgi:NTP pyrophosphatase (non-canonical NTP hydrolase)